jgi:uncharacterized protein (DUF1501 family)
MNESRREFLKKSGCALSMVGLASQMGYLGKMNAMAQKALDAQESAPEGGENYKALVLLFFSGGNDGNNTVIPNHNDATLSNYTAYFNARNTQQLAIAQASLLPVAVPRMGGLSYGLRPALGPGAAGAINPGIHELWAQQKMAVVSNCGTLVAPMSKTQYLNNSVTKPYQLFSHSDQVTQYQTSVANTQAFTGWGGRISDRMTLGSNPNGLLPMITSISGAQLFTAGQSTLPIAINNANTGLNNVLNPAGFSSSATNQARLLAFNQLRSQDLSSDYVAAASHVTDLAMQANSALATFQEVTVAFPTSSIGLQLKQIARLIKKRADLNINRQIFYCQLGGFDTHSSQIAGQNTLLGQFSQAARAFYDEMVVQGVANDVTLFTLSDFSRTFIPASSGATAGTDHAWANHSFVIGGSVLGGDFYGMNTSNGTPYPTLAIGTAGPDDTSTSSSSRGRWIPTTSVDQYAATLARWFGLPDIQQAEVFPNIGNFASSNLGFLP